MLRYSATLGVWTPQNVINRNAVAALGHTLGTSHIDLVDATALRLRGLEMKKCSLGSASAPQPRAGGRKPFGLFRTAGRPQRHLLTFLPLIKMVQIAISTSAARNSIMYACIYTDANFSHGRTAAASFVLRGGREAMAESCSCDADLWNLVSATHSAHREARRANYAHARFRKTLVFSDRFNAQTRPNNT